MNAELIMFVAGISSFVLTSAWVMSRHLRERYAIGWMAASSILMLVGIFPASVMRLAEVVNMSYAAFALLIVGTIGYVLFFSITITLSRLMRMNVDLAQKVAFLELELRQAKELQGGNTETTEHGEYPYERKIGSVHG